MVSRTSAERHQVRPGGAVAPEEARVVRGRRSGRPIAVVVDSTVLGPALGGCRFAPYPGWREGLADAAQLAAAMTEKCALAGLDHGGGKTVVVVPPGPPPTGARRRDVLLDVGDAVEAFGGRYLTGPDVGTGPADLGVVRERTRFALCRPVADGGSGDSSAPTAAGVLASIEALVAAALPGRTLATLSVAVVGLGHVGLDLARRLRSAGATVLGADVDAARRPAAEDAGVLWTDVVDALRADVDVLVPAAAGTTVARHDVDILRCRAIVGPGNNQLGDADVEEALHARGVLWVPESIAGAGGVVHATAVELRGATPADAAAEVAGIGATLAAVLADARRQGVPPARVARDRVHARLAAAGGDTSGVTASGTPRDGADGTRRSYDTLAVTYADRIGHELGGKPLDRALLAAFAEDAGPGARVLDVGCGPGHVDAHLASLGLAPVGVDLSPGMIDVARAAHPEERFVVASVLDLALDGPVGDALGGGSGGAPWSGAVAFYSLIHLDRAGRAAALARIRAVLAPGAPLLVGGHEGTEVRHVEDLWGHAVALDFHFLDGDELGADLESAGFTVEAVLRRAPYPDVEVETARIYLSARASVVA